MPLTQLTSSEVPFLWSQAADTAFNRLKCLFTSVPVLTHPDPALQFVVEVDASNTGIGAVQRSPPDNRLHPSAFFSRRLTLAERNYDVGNRELLAVVLALQEWRHWLEGSTHPFVVWADHKNLSCLLSARRLNSRQDHWALFLGRFQFTLTYCPGSRNIKPDDLSHHFASLVEDSPEDTSLPSSCVVGAARWEIEQVVQEAQGDLLTPVNCPPDRMFVPPSARSPVLQWGHASKVACHPGVHRTLSLLQQCFWWPTISSDTREFVSACSNCAQSKPSHQRPVGLLHPLPIPHRPCCGLCDWTPTFRTSALETANLLIQHVFRLHGIPQDIVSDRGPRFSSQVWKAFCQALGASASLSSGYHPQTNGLMERANQDLESALRCITSRHTAAWSIHLP